MLDDGKVVRFLAKLVRLTQEGKLKWVDTFIDPKLGPEMHIASKVLTAKLEDMDMRLFRYRTGFWSPYPSTEHARLDIESSHPILHEEERLRLELVDPEGNADAEFEGLPVLQDLFDVARFSRSDVEKKIERVLSL